MKLGARKALRHRLGSKMLERCLGRGEEGDNTNMLYYELKLGCDLLIYGFGQNG